jgi:hypothetical protein
MCVTGKFPGIQTHARTHARGRVRAHTHAQEALVKNLTEQRASNIEVVKENRNLLVELRTQEERNMGLLQMVLARALS